MSHPSMTTDPITATYALISDQNMFRLERETLDPAALRGYDLLLEAEMTVVSAGTELANFTGIDPGVWEPGNYNSYPYRPGYGLVGRVRKTGPDVLGFAPGQRVFCWGKHASHQVYRATPGSRWSAVLPAPDDLPADELVMLRMALIALTAPQIAGAEPGDTVAVFGLGLVGNLAAQLYQLAGARVIGLDPNPARCDLARECGIATALDVAPDEQIPTIHELTDSQGAHVVVDAAGSASVLLSAIRACADYGDVVSLGSPRTPLEIDVTPALSDLHHRWISLHGALEWRLPPRREGGFKHSIQDNFERLVGQLRAGRLAVAPLISHRIAPGDLGRAYRGLLSDPATYWGVVIDWRDGQG